MKRLLSLVVVVVLAGCESTSTQELRKLAAQPNIITYPVMIWSDPPGAVIEVNNEFVGVAPCTVEIDARRDGRFYGLTTIQANPKVPGNFVQRKVFTFGDKVPAKVYFDTGLGPVTRRVGYFDDLIPASQ